MKNRQFWHDAQAAAAIEYGLIVALIALAALIGIQALGGGTSAMWNDIRDKVMVAFGNE